jgi:hypothetical protein
MGKIQKSTRLPKDQADRVERYAERRDITEADALRRLVRVGLDEEADDPIITDGGYLRDDDPWVELLTTIATHALRFATLTLLIGLLAGATTLTAPVAGFPLPRAAADLLFGLFVTAPLFTLVPLTAFTACIAFLERQMHPSEAPVSRYFYTPDDADDRTEVVA